MNDNSQIRSVENIREVKECLGPKIDMQYTFNFPIEIVWNMLKDLEGFLSRDGKSGNFEYNDSELSKVGTKFYFQYLYMATGLEVVEVLDTPFIKKIEYECFYNGFMDEFTYRGCWALYKNSIDNETLLVFTVHYHNEVQVSSDLKEVLLKVNRDLFKSNNDYLKKKYYFKEEHQEAITINADLEKLWNFTINVSCLKKKLKYLADEIVSDVEQLAENSRLSFIFHKYNILATFRVSNFSAVDKTKRLLELELIEETQLDFKKADQHEEAEENQIPHHKKNNKERETTVKRQGKGDYVVPNQIISFELVEITKAKTFLAIKHNFKKKYDEDLLKNLSDQKTKVLKKFKKLFNR